MGPLMADRRSMVLFVRDPGTLCLDTRTNGRTELSASRSDALTGIIAANSWPRDAIRLRRICRAAVRQLVKRPCQSPTLRRAASTQPRSSRRSPVPRTERRRRSWASTALVCHWSKEALASASLATPPRRVCLPARPSGGSRTAMDLPEVRAPHMRGLRRRDRPLAQSPKLHRSTVVVSSAVSLLPIDKPAFRSRNTFPGSLTELFPRATNILVTMEMLTGFRLIAQLPGDTCQRDPVMWAMSCR